ncbi:MAG: hypothetical protein H6Q65_1421 [Firmicutes bacterium]|nr:hypothetical protein [Bacillota bacterium]
MNIVIGALIGFINALWIGIIIMSIAWGLIYCLYQIITGKQKNSSAWQYANQSGKKNPKLYYFMLEFLSTTSTTIITGIIVHAGISFLLHR